MMAKEPTWIRLALWGMGLLCIVAIIGSETAREANANASSHGKVLAKTCSTGGAATMFQQAVSVIAATVGANTCQPDDGTSERNHTESDHEEPAQGEKDSLPDSDPEQNGANDSRRGEESGGSKAAPGSQLDTEDPPDTENDETSKNGGDESKKSADFDWIVFGFPAALAVLGVIFAIYIRRRKTGKDDNRFLPVPRSAPSQVGTPGAAQTPRWASSTEPGKGQAGHQKPRSTQKSSLGPEPASAESLAKEAAKTSHLKREGKRPSGHTRKDSTKKANAPVADPFRDPVQHKREKTQPRDDGFYFAPPPGPADTDSGIANLRSEVSELKNLIMRLLRHVKQLLETVSPKRAMGDRVQENGSQGVVATPRPLLGQLVEDRLREQLSDLSGLMKAKWEEAKKDLDQRLSDLRAGCKAEASGLDETATKVENLLVCLKTNAGGMRDRLPDLAHRIEQEIEKVQAIASEFQTAKQNLATITDATSEDELSLPRTRHEQIIAEYERMLHRHAVSEFVEHAKAYTCELLRDYENRLVRETEQIVKKKEPVARADTEVVGKLRHQVVRSLIRTAEQHRELGFQGESLMESVEREVDSLIQDLARWAGYELISPSVGDTLDGDLHISIGGVRTTPEHRIGTIAGVKHVGLRTHGGDVIEKAYVRMYI